MKRILSEHPNSGNQEWTARRVLAIMDWPTTNLASRAIGRFDQDIEAVFGKFSGAVNPA